MLVSYARPRISNRRRYEVSFSLLKCLSIIIYSNVTIIKISQRPIRLILVSEITSENADGPRGRRCGDLPLFESQMATCAVKQLMS